MTKRTFKMFIPTFFWDVFLAREIGWTWVQHMVNGGTLCIETSLPATFSKHAHSFSDVPSSGGWRGFLIGAICVKKLRQTWTWTPNTPLMTSKWRRHAFSVKSLSRRPAHTRLASWKSYIQYVGKTFARCCLLVSHCFALWRWSTSWPIRSRVRIIVGESSLPWSTVSMSNHQFYVHSNPIFSQVFTCSLV